MKLTNKFWGLMPLFLSAVTHAGDMGNQSSHLIIAASGGPSWTSPGRSQTLNLQPDVIAAYVPDNLVNSTILGNAELFFGLEKSYFEQVKSQFGFAAYWSGFAKLNGYVQEDADPNFQNYSYQYRINHWHIAAKTKWIFENEQNINPYISGSLGLGFNRSYHYSSTPLIVQETAQPPFQSYTKLAFSYTVGAGFQRQINQNLSVGLGYELGSWGASNLDRASGQTLDKGLSLNNLYTQSAVFNVSYFL